MSSKYKLTGPINSVVCTRDFKRYVIVFSDDSEIVINRKHYAMMAIEYYLKKGVNARIFEETVIKTINGHDYQEDKFRIEMTDRVKYEILAEKLK